MSRNVRNYIQTYLHTSIQNHAAVYFATVQESGNN